MAKGGKKSDINLKIHQMHGYLNDDKTKVVATVTWTDKDDPKLNIRSCYEDDDGELKLGKGISLSTKEVNKLTEILVSARNTGEMQKITREGKKAVNFSKVFSEADGIIEKRDAGQTTQDGFTILKRRYGVKI